MSNWEPIKDGERVYGVGHPFGGSREYVLTMYVDGVATLVSQGEYERVIQDKTERGLETVCVALPANVRLCRNPDRSLLTVRDFCAEVMRRADSNNDGDAHPHGIGVHFERVMEEWGLARSKA